MSFVLIRDSADETYDIKSVFVSVVGSGCTPTSGGDVHFATFSNLVYTFNGLLC